MKKRPVSFSPVRRQLLVGAGGLCAFSTIPLNGLAMTVSQPIAALQVALGRFEESLGHWRPIGFRRSSLSAEQPLKIVIRGSQGSGFHAKDTALAVSLVYHSMPQLPFELGLEPGNVGHGGNVVHVAAGSLAGLRIRRTNASASSGVFCALTHFLRPVLEPGFYVIMVGAGQHSALPAWSELPAPDELGGLPVVSATTLSMPPSLITLHVTAV